MLKRNNHGFTLIEMLISIVVIGAVLAITSGLFAQTTSLERKTDRLTQKDLSKRTAQVIESIADSELNGRLPIALTDGDYYSAFVKDTATESYLIREAFFRNMSVAQLANNGKPSPQQRVYQVVRGLTATETTRGFAGPVVELTYDVGVVYVSGCSMSDESCHPNSETSIAGFSPELTSENIASFKVIEPDHGLVRLSSLGSQRRLLKETMKRIDDLEAALTAIFTANYLANEPDGSINYYPQASGNPPATVDPSTNNGCADNWINLSDGDSGRQIMAQIGLQPELSGQTAWGGQIQYCRDYLANGSGNDNEPPHNAALRIHKKVSTAAAPSSDINSVIFGI